MRAASEEALQLLEERQTRLERLVAESLMKLSGAILEIANKAALAIALIGESKARPADMREAKRELVERVLKETGGNMMQTARKTKINLKTLYNLLPRLGIDVKKIRSEAQEGE